MNALDYIPYLGHASLHPPLDALLTAHKIAWRPTVRRNLDTTFFVPGTGIVLAFTIGADGMGIARKSAGDYVFEQLTMTILEEDKRDGKYTGPLPRGLLPGDSRARIEEKLGPATRKMPQLDNYYLDGLVWIVAFEGERFQFLELAVPTNGKRKHGLCPA